MKRLTLVRHAKATPCQTEHSDFDRPLNDKGQAEARKTGYRLAQFLHQTPFIISSEALRARMTAERIAEAFHCLPGCLHWQTRIYEASPQQLLQILNEQPDIYDPLLIVGHNPGLTQFANLLANDTLDSIPTAGIYTILLPVAHWQEVQFGIGRGLTPEFS